MTIADNLNLEKRIRDAIDNIKINAGDFFKNINEIKFKNDLIAELDVAVESSKQESEYYLHYFYDINQEQVFEFLHRSEENGNVEDIFFPLSVTKHEISFYLQTAEKYKLNADLFQKINDLYNKVNKLSNNKQSYALVENTGNHIVLSINSKTDNDEKRILVAVCNLNINCGTPDDIKKHDIERQDLSYYKYTDVKQLIVSASREGAKYVLMPEFAIKYTDAFKIIKLCAKLKVSLISGLTHYFYCDRGIKYAENLTLIYSSPLNMPIIHRKRYIPCSEYEFLARNDIIATESNNEYIIIRDGKLSYTEMTCFEATSILDRASFQKEKLDAIFMPVYNRDTIYFSSLIESLSRDLSVFVLQANVNDFGDSRITGPLKSIEKDIVKIKGGKNHYFVIGELDFAKRLQRRIVEKEFDNIKYTYGGKDFIREMVDYFDKRQEEIKERKDPSWKPQSAGSINIED